MLPDAVGIRKGVDAVGFAERLIDFTENFVIRIEIGAAPVG